MNNNQTDFDVIVGWWEAHQVQPQLMRSRSRVTASYCWNEPFESSLVAALYPLACSRNLISHDHFSRPKFSQRE
jgi:hypothetical protein